MWPVSSETSALREEDWERLSTGPISQEQGWENILLQLARLQGDEEKKSVSNR